MIKRALVKYNKWLSFLWCLLFAGLVGQWLSLIAGVWAGEDGLVFRLYLAVVMVALVFVAYFRFYDRKHPTGREPHVEASDD